MSTADDEIHAKIEAFASELAVLVRRAAREAVTSVLESAPLVGPVPASGRKAPTASARAVKASALAKPTNASPAAKASVSKKAAAPKRAPGEKRPPAELAKLVEKLAEYVKAHPGQRMEAIGKALETSTKDLTLPVKKLLAARRIRTEGEKRATEYFPA